MKWSKLLFIGAQKNMNLLLFFCMVALFNSACSPAEDEGSDITEDIPSISQPAPEVGIIEQDLFWVDIRPTVWQGVIHQEGSVSSPCEINITSTETAEKHIRCVYDTPEVSAFLQDHLLQINVTPNMCNYLEFIPYSFANWEIGRGPEEVWVQEHQDANGNTTGFSCRESALDPFGSCDGLPEWELSEGLPVCRYNHSQRDPDFPNCCYGNYDFHFQVDNAGTIDITPVANLNWGEELDRDCVGGPSNAFEDWGINEGVTQLTKAGIGDGNLPLNVFYDSLNTGLNEAFLLEAPVSLPRDRDANVITFNSVAGALPNQVSPTYTDATGDIFPFSFSADYQFRCLDDSGELLRSIRLTLREWNTLEQYNNFIDSSAGDPNRAGTEGVDCSYDDPLGGPCDDYLDWDNFFNGAGYDFPSLLFGLPNNS